MAEIKVSELPSGSPLVTDIAGVLIQGGATKQYTFGSLPISTLTQAALDLKVDKITGKGLSTEDYTTTEKNKLSGIESGAEVNEVNEAPVDGKQYARKDGDWEEVTATGGGQVDSVVGGTNIGVDNTDPENPIVNLDDSISIETVVLDPTYTVTGSETEGTIYYNKDEDTLDIVQNGSVLQVGQETQYNIKGDEVAGIGNGKLVMFSGSDGNSGNLKGKLAISDGTYPSKVLMGIATQSIANGSYGKVTSFGKVRGISTDGSLYSESWVDGDIIYPNSAVPGGLTKVMPTSPAWKNPVAVVVNSHSTNGELFVRCEYLPEIGNLNDVDLSNEATGDILMKNGTHYYNSAVIGDTKSWTGFINNENIDVSGDTSTRKITLTSTDIKYYWHGQVKSLGTSWLSSAHGTDTSKVYYLYSTDGTTFSWSETVWDFSYVQVAFAYYNTTLASWLYQREPHGTMPYECHQSDHYNTGTYKKNGGGIPTAGTYALNSSADADITPGFDQVTIWDEDLPTTIRAWIQGTYTTMYIAGSNVATFNTTASFPFRFTTSGYINVNNPTTGAETEGATGKFYNVYQILIPMASDTNSQKFRTVFLQPQNTYNTLALAQAEDFRSLSLGNFTSLSPELLGLTRLTYGTNASYGTTGKVQLNGISYLSGNKASQVSIGGFTPTNHSRLSNLAWLNSGHTGTADKIIGFNSSGLATEILLSGLTFDGTTLTRSGSNPIFETFVAGEQTTGLIARFTVKGTQTIAGVKISLATLPTGADFKVDVRRNGTATTNSIFTSDRTIDITTGQSATNGIYTTTKTTIDNGTCAENDVLYVTIVSIGTTISGTSLEVVIF